jgi:hypothetical protein
VEQIKIGFCVAYDWYFLEYSLPLVYPYADTICLALDKDRISWTGNQFDFDERGFTQLIERIDQDKKIVLLQEDFHLPELKPMENEVRQRNRIAEFMGKEEGWHIQLDSDEYCINFKGFVDYLQSHDFKKPINVCCPWITMYKRIDDGFLMVQPNRFDNIEFIPIATNKPHYEHGRRNGYFNHLTEFPILHQSWARSEQEVWQKLSNWGHRFDSDINAYFQLWKRASLENYTTYKNFNQASPEAWPALFLLPLDKERSVIELMDRGIELPLRIKRIDLILKNSMIWSYFQKMISIFK